MTTPLKIGIGLALIGVIALVATQGQKLLDQFAVRIKGYGTPKLNFSSWVLTLPVKLELINPTPAPINIDKISGNVSLMKNNSFQSVAKFDQSLSIPSGSSDRTITTTIDLKKFFSSNFAAASLEILTTGKLRIRTDLVVQYAQVTVTPEPFDTVVNVI